MKDPRIFKVDVYSQRGRYEVVESSHHLHRKGKCRLFTKKNWKLIYHLRKITVHCLSVDRGKHWNKQQRRKDRKDRLSVGILWVWWRFLATGLLIIYCNFSQHLPLGTGFIFFRYRWSFNFLRFVTRKKTRLSFCLGLLLLYNLQQLHNKFSSFLISSQQWEDFVFILKELHQLIQGEYILTACTAEH